MKITNIRQFQKLLRANGYEVVRNSGGHRIWSNGTRHLSINAEKPNKLVMKRLIKEYDLKEVC